MKRFICALLSIYLGILIASSLHASPPDDDFPPPPHGRGFFMGKMMMDVLDKLDLSQEQREKIKATHENTREKIKELRKAMRENMKNLKEELGIYKSDEKRIQEIMQKIKDVGAELFETHVNTFIKMKEILTPGQFETFKKEMERRKEEIREHFRKHHGKEPAEPSEIED